jgi:DNA primase catalytic core
MSGRLSQASVEEVKERADLVELVRADTELRKAGIEWVGRCPFHEERSGSFYVNPVKKVYHCYGCGVGGDAVTYVRERHALDFVGALEWLAERFNVQLTYEEESPEVAARRRGEDRRRELMAATAAFYHRVLRKSPLAEGARAYLTERGVTWEMAERFQLGFSPDERQVIKGARTKGFADRELDEMGITRPGRAGPVDRMAGRLIFTLFDSRGHPIAFAGRRLPPDESGPKYVNSPETPLWKKGSTLYGLHLARTAIAKGEQAIVVEGYTDVIGLVQAGYDNVVASMGTALTQPQLRELRKLARNVVLLFDADTPEATRLCAASSSPRARHRLEGAGCAAAEGLGSGGGGGERPEAVDRMLGKAQSVLAFRVGLVLGAAGHRYDARTRRSLRWHSRNSCAACPPRPSATSSCASPRRASGSRRTPPRVSPRAARCAAEQPKRSRLRVSAWTRSSATNGFCWRLRSHPAMPDQLCWTGST